MLISSEREETINALDIVRKIAQSVDGEMEEYKRNMKLEEISTNFDKTSISRYREKRFTKRELESRKISNYYDLVLRDKTKVSVTMTFFYIKMTGILKSFGMGSCTNLYFLHIATLSGVLVKKWRKNGFTS